MGKSKRNRKKQNRQVLPAEAVSPVLEKSASRLKNKLLIVATVAIVLIGVFLIFHKSTSPPVAVPSTPSQTSPSGIPLVQSGSSGSLSPSGSLDLQPTGSATQAGSVQ